MWTYDSDPEQWKISARVSRFQRTKEISNSTLDRHLSADLPGMPAKLSEQVIST